MLEKWLEEAGAIILATIILSAFYYAASGLMYHIDNGTLF